MELSLWDISDQYELWITVSYVILTDPFSDQGSIGEVGFLFLTIFSLLLHHCSGRKHLWQQASIFFCWWTIILQGTAVSPHYLTFLYTGLHVTVPFQLYVPGAPNMMKLLSGVKAADRPCWQKPNCSCPWGRPSQNFHSPPSKSSLSVRSSLRT